MFEEGFPLVGEEHCLASLVLVVEVQLLLAKAP